MSKFNIAEAKARFSELIRRAVRAAGAARQGGYGKALLLHLARIAVERGRGRFEWSVLDWNVDAQRFYESLGATAMPDWRITRGTGDALARMAKLAE